MPNDTALWASPTAPVARFETTGRHDQRW